MANEEYLRISRSIIEQVEADTVPPPTKESIKIETINKSSPMKPPAPVEQEIIEFDTLDQVKQPDIESKSLINGFGALTGETHVPDLREHVHKDVPQEQIIG